MNKYISESVNREQQKSDVFMREVKEIIDEKDKEIERLEKEKEREAKRNDLEIALNVKLIDERDILKKEKEWLLNKYVELQHMPNSINMADKHQIRYDVTKCMQQALKEE